MENPFKFDRYVELPREEAYGLFRDEKNLKTLKFILVSVGIPLFVFAVVFLAKGGPGIVTLLFCLAFLSFAGLRIFYRKIFSVSNIRKRLYLLFITSLLLFLVINIAENYTENLSENKAKITGTKDNESGIVFGITKDGDGSVTGIIFFFSVVLIIFRFSRNDIVQLFSLTIGLPVLTDLILYHNFSLEDKAVQVIIAGLFFIISYSSESKKRKNFFGQYSVYHSRHFDNLRMKKELNYAREIQLAMLPENETVIGNLQIAAASTPANEVGGDYYDYFRISDNLTGIFICDVSGHGVASALLLSGLRSCMHLILEDTTNPKEVFAKLNKMVRKTQNRKMFVTAIFAVIDSEKNICTLFNAGHLPPYKISGESGELFKIRRHGITLGAIDNINDDASDSEVVFDFNKGDKIFLYTDGVVEAMDNKRGEYGFARLESFLNENACKPPKELLDGIQKDVNAFTGGAELADDISILIIAKN